jgi:DNA replication ATP-dependent helicase Dna2
MTSRISPSRIANYFFFDCDRFLRFSATPDREKRAEGIPVVPMDTEVVAQAVFEGGYAWEEEVVGRVLAGRVILAPSQENMPLRDRQFREEESPSSILAMKPGEYIYQPCLAAPESFYERYGLDSALITLSPCRPDLIECYLDNGHVAYRVIDVKASLGVKLTHRIQATFYCLLLQHCLEAWGPKDLEVSTQAGIWLANDDQPTLFDTRAMRPPLETFLEEHLQAVMLSPAEEARWHVYQRCGWCGFLD